MMGYPSTTCASAALDMFQANVSLSNVYVTFVGAAVIVFAQRVSHSFACDEPGFRLLAFVHPLACSTAYRDDKITRTAAAAFFGEIWVLVSAVLRFILLLCTCGEHDYGGRGLSVFGNRGTALFEYGDQWIDLHVIWQASD